MIPTSIPRAVLAAVLTAAAGSALAQAASPVGLWRTIDDETKQPRSTVRIVDSGGALSGRIESLADPTKQEARCDDCKDERKGQKIIGMTVLRNARAADGGAWEGGEILDPVNGKTYKLRLKPLDGGNRLEVRGSLGPFFRTQVWERAGN